jgi:transcription antitermination factor NusG
MGRRSDMKRVGDNPPARFPTRPIGEAREPWWIAKVKPRQEKALAADFIRSGIEYYLPMITKVTRRRDNNKPRKSVLPLFPGYVSYCAAHGQERRVFATERVVNIIEVRYQKRFIYELEQIYCAIELGISLEPLHNIHTLQPGTPVIVQSGALKGIRGTVSRSQGSHKLVLSVEGLGRAALTVDISTVKPEEEG